MDINQSGIVESRSPRERQLVVAPALLQCLPVLDDLHYLLILPSQPLQQFPLGLYTVLQVHQVGLAERGIVLEFVVDICYVPVLGEEEVDLFLLVLDTGSKGVPEHSLVSHHDHDLL